LPSRKVRLVAARWAWHYAPMNKALLAAATAFALALPLAAQEEPKGYPFPAEIIAAAPKADWVAIPAEDLLVMTLTPDSEANPRIVVIQLMPAPFSQGWVHNIRLLARSGWYDGISVNRVQDNYVTQWGDPNYDNPEATGEPKPLPQGLKVMGEAEYLASLTLIKGSEETMTSPAGLRASTDPYGSSLHALGWQLAGRDMKLWPVHCYGMVGVGRNYSPDTGSGAELYTVIGHAPRQLDRNIALVGRVIEGMEHLSSLPRGKGELGFYAADEADKRTPILSVRVASDLPAPDQPRLEYLSTESQTFETYAEAIANRRDPFFITPAGGADICNIRVPVRRVAE